VIVVDAQIHLWAADRPDRPWPGNRSHPHRPGSFLEEDALKEMDADLTRLPCTYRQAITLFTEELSWLAGDDQELVMGRGLCEWLGWATR
jgi:hypothetical protein